MAEVTHLRKHKIELKEYDYSSDVENRVLMSQFSALDIEVLEEILYSSLRIPLSILEKNVGLSKEKLMPILEKLTPTKLFEIHPEYILVDKEMRKYYEFQILKFEEDFKPGMEYLQGLLRKVPIHILPLWYSISRTSDNIFESIVEKYLLTPQIFQRYLMDLNFEDPVQKGIMNAVYKSPNFQVDAADMIEKFDLTQQQFEENMLQLEFSFVCCIKFIKAGKHFKEIITPFEEWKEYLCKVLDTEPESIIDEEAIIRTKDEDFGIVEEMSRLLEGKLDLASHEAYVKKLVDLGLATYENGRLSATQDGTDWMQVPSIEQAIYLYRHPKNTLYRDDLPQELLTHRMLRDAEKSVSRLVNTGWVYLDDFLKGIFIPLKEEHAIELKKVGRTWKYQLPEYSETELEFFKAIVTDWLFEAGITATGTKDGKEVFCLTPFGQDLYGTE